MRARRRLPAHLGDESVELTQLASDDPTQLHSLIQDANTEALARAISGLPDKYRIPLMLAYYNESSYDDIAASLAISRNHVGVLLLRARQQLRTTLDESGEAFEP